MIDLVAPLGGPILLLASVPDPVFSRGVIGDGVAIEPVSSTLASPCAGTVTQLHRSGHALTVTSDGGAEILCHIGIDTVSLGGRGFTPHVTVGQRVRAGEALVSFDADAVARAAPCLQTLVIVANGERFAIEWRATGHVVAGDRLMTLRALSAEARPSGATPGPDDPTAREAEATVAHGGGLHARPAALVRAAARRFVAEIVVAHGAREARVTSVVSLMGLGVHEGDRVTVRARGRDAVAALEAVVSALETATPGDHASEGTAQAAPPAPRTRPGGPGLPGVSAAPGLAVGRAVRLDAGEPEVARDGQDPDAERARLEAALAQVGRELADAFRHAGAAEERAILGAHQAILDDPEIIDAARIDIAAGRSAGHAFRAAVSAQCEILSRLGDPLLGERVADLRDLERRVLRAASGEAARPSELPEGSILVAEDLGPSDLLRVPRGRLAGLATVRGGATSHVSILSRALGIPALVAVGPELLGVATGAEVLLDADRGFIDLAPSAADVARARAAMALAATRRTAAVAACHGPATTLDGQRIEVAANVAGEDDAREAVRSGADAVGLLRTELLFIDRAQAPSVEEQRAAYQGVIDALGGRAAIIRTLDVGNDKELAYLPLPAEPNPALGTRGIRLGFARPDVLDAQLTALLAVRPRSACRIMLPMIADATELLRVRARLDELARASGDASRPELGVMVEVPSAALLADQLAAHADFLSIGTNDLTQYALAMDRCNAALAPRVDGLHPAVLRLIAHTARGAARHGKWVGVCGALASDLEAVPVLIGLGVTELSVSPPSVPEVKARVRRLDRAACQRAVLELLELPSATEVRARVRALWPASR